MKKIINYIVFPFSQYETQWNGMEETNFEN